MERDHRTPVDIFLSSANHLLRNEFVSHECEGGLQRDPAQQAALRTQSLRGSARPLSELGRDQLQRQRGFSELPGADARSDATAFAWTLLSGELHLGA